MIEDRESSTSTQIDTLSIQHDQDRVLLDGSSLADYYRNKKLQVKGYPWDKEAAWGSFEQTDLAFAQVERDAAGVVVTNTLPFCEIKQDDPTVPTFLFNANVKVVGKATEPWVTADYNYNFLGSVHDVATFAARGHSFTTVMAGHHRCDDNFAVQNYLFEDIDNKGDVEILYEEDAQHPDVQNATLTYTSYNSGKDGRMRWRNFYLLETPERDPVKARLNNRAWAWHRRGIVDDATIALSQPFFGSHPVTGTILKVAPGKFLSDERLAEIVAAYQEAHQKKTPRAKTVFTGSSERWEGNTNSSESLGLSREFGMSLLPFLKNRGQPGDGRRYDAFRTVTAYVTEYGREDAFEMLLEWNADSTWPGQTFKDVVAGVAAGAVSMRTAIMLAKQNGFERKVIGFNPRPPLCHKTSLEYSEKYCRLLTPVAQRLVVIKAPMGSGKSTVVCQALKETEKVLVVTDRINQTNAWVSDLGCIKYSDIDNLATTKAKKIVTTFDSLWLFTPAALEGWTVVIDEASAAVKHLKGKTLVGKRKAVLDSLLWVLPRAEKIYLMDADMDDTTIDHWQHAAMISDDDTYLIHNTFVDTTREAEFYKSTGAIQAEVMRRLAAGAKLPIACTSKKTVEYLERRINEELPHLKVLSIHSGQNKKVLAKLLANPEGFREYDAIIYSPSIFRGADINLKGHFDAVFLVAEGNHISPRDQAQALRRVRYPKSPVAHIFVDPHGANDITDGAELYKEMVKRREAVLELYTVDAASGQRLIDTKYETLVKLQCDAEAADNLAKTNPLVNLQLLLEADGYTCRDTDAVETGKEKKARLANQEAYTDEHHAAVFAAGDVSEETYNELYKGNLELDDEQELVKERAEIKHFLNGSSEVGLESVIKSGIKVKQLRVHENIALTKTGVATLHKNLNPLDKTILGDYTEDLPAKIALLRKLEASIGSVWNTGEIDLTQFEVVLAENAADVKRYLGFSYQPGKTRIQQAFSSYLALFGLKTEKAGRRQVAGVRRRLYKIHSESQEFVKGILELRAVKTKAQEEERMAEEKRYQEWQQEMDASAEVEWN